MKKSHRNFGFVILLGLLIFEVYRTFSGGILRIEVVTFDGRPAALAEVSILPVSGELPTKRIANAQGVVRCPYPLCGNRFVSIKATMGGETLCDAVYAVPWHRSIRIIGGKAGQATKTK